MDTSWQIEFQKVKKRNQFLLMSEKLADCRFLVGIPPNQRTISGHRLILAMASPVFEDMFYGSLPVEDDPIRIPDVQPKAFKAMLDYIYTDEISVSSFDDACELGNVGKKYILPYLVDNCTNFLVADLGPKNACRAYEFGKLCEEPRLIKRSMEVIADNTMDVIADPSFMKIHVSTLVAILDQNFLNIDSELDLFNCLVKFANKRGILNDETKESSEESSRMDEDTLRQAVKKIRFRAMTLKEFSEGPARSKLLNQNQVLGIFKNISNPTINYAMPDGFSQSSNRGRVMKRCILRPRFGEYRDYILLNDRLEFKVDATIYLLGVQLKLKESDHSDKLLSVHIEKNGLEIACTSSIKNGNDLMFEPTFNSPILIKSNLYYTMYIDRSKGFRGYQMPQWGSEMVCNGVKFSIRGANGPIGGIVFST